MVGTHSHACPLTCCWHLCLVPCPRLEPNTTMSETTKPAAPGQAAEEKEKAAPAPTPSLDPAPVANSKGEEPSTEAFRVSLAAARTQGRGPGVRDGGSISGAVSRRRAQAAQGKYPPSRAGPERGQCRPSPLCVSWAAALQVQDSSSCLWGCCRRNALGASLAGTACWGPQALEMLSPASWHQGWVLPPAPSGHPLHAEVLQCCRGMEEAASDRAGTETLWRHWGSVPPKCCSEAVDKG